MHRRCHICLHPERLQIDHALSDLPVSSVALTYGIPFNALSNHAEHHTGKPAAEFPEVAPQTHVQHLLASALPPITHPTYVLYNRPQAQSLPALTRLLALSAKLPATPEATGFNEKAWWQTRAKLVAALQRFPDALQAVNKALDDSPKMFK